MSNLLEVADHVLELLVRGRLDALRVVVVRLPDHRQDPRVELWQQIREPHSA
jgi:hypothetical protein